VTLFAWIAFSIAAGLFASVRRNRSGIGWFAISMVGSPLLAFLLLFILYPLDPVDEAFRRIEDNTFRRIVTVSQVSAMVVAVALIFAALIFLTTLASAQQTVIRDAAGRTVGTTTQSGNQTVIRDAGGRTIGTSTDYPDSDTVLRDAGGRTIGTISQGHR